MIVTMIRIYTASFMKRFSLGWAFLGAYVVGIPFLLMDSWKSPVHEKCFKIYMAVVVIWNVVFILHKVSRRKQKRRENEE